MLRFNIISLFPEVIDAYVGASILGRAQKEDLLKVETHQLRDFVDNKWGKADERPYGGGPGMVLQAEPFVRGVENILHTLKLKDAKLVKKEKTRVIITSAGGMPLTNELAKKLSKLDRVIILCGRYEGIDARVKKILKATEVSVGNYILTGGEVPAMAVVDCVARQVSGVLGKLESLEESRVASHDIYTRPEVITHAGKNYRVPKVLREGNHAKIDEWRNKRRSGGLV